MTTETLPYKADPQTVPFSLSGMLQGILSSSPDKLSGIIDSGINGVLQKAPAGTTRDDIANALGNKALSYGIDSSAINSVVDYAKGKTSAAELTSQAPSILQMFALAASKIFGIDLGDHSVLSAEQARYATSQAQVTAKSASTAYQAI